MTLVVHLGTLLRHCSPKYSPCPAVAICVHRINLTILHQSEIVTMEALSDRRCLLLPPVRAVSELPRNSEVEPLSPGLPAGADSNRQQQEAIQHVHESSTAAKIWPVL